MQESALNPAQTFNTYRKSDAVLIVCQNNDKRTVEIAALNFEASRVTGYSNDEMVGKSLFHLLPKRIIDMLHEGIEYKLDSADLQTVLAKISPFVLVNRAGEEIRFRLRVINGQAMDHNPWFHLVLTDEDNLRRANAFREMLKENFKGHEALDERTGLTSRASMIKDLELVRFSVAQKHTGASFAVLDINHYAAMKERYRQATCDKLHRHIGQVCKQKLRPEDTVGTLTESTLGIIMVDASQEAARMVLNRLRWSISTNPLEIPPEAITAQVNIVFTEIDGTISEEAILKKCEDFIAEVRAKPLYNTLQLAVTHERRDSDDRRRQDTPVAVDRRRKQRRGKRK